MLSNIIPRNMVPIRGTIEDITYSSSDCCSRLITLTTDQRQTTYVMITSDTYVMNQLNLRRGMHITAFYDSKAPMTLIYPPQYRAVIVVPAREQDQVFLGNFDSNLVSYDRSLKLNLSPFTMITTANGQTFTCNPGNRTLLVIYQTTTRSIPPQTTPSKIIVIC